MSSSDFRQITAPGRKTPARPDRLFRAAVSAFCSLPRPNRSEIAQLEDLTLPLYARTSVEARRYVAAALSETRSAPRRLVLTLCAEPVDVAAPLLIRSPMLSDVDLLAIIGRQGRGHAAVIGRRPDLNPAIASLVRALAASRPQPKRSGDPAPAIDLPATAPVNGIRAEEVRRSLRALMTAERPRRDDETALAAWRDAPVYDRLLGSALTGQTGLYRTALAEALGLDYRASLALATSPASPDLPKALKSLGLGLERSFLVAASARPGDFADVEAIRAFIGAWRRAPLPAIERSAGIDALARTAS